MKQRKRNRGKETEEKKQRKRNRGKETEEKKQRKRNRGKETEEKKQSYMVIDTYLLANRLTQRYTSIIFFFIILAGHAIIRSLAKQLHIVTLIHLSPVCGLHFEFVCTVVLAQFKLPE